MSDLLNDLLDATLDDLADLPEFKPFPPGAHKVLASFEAKKIGEKQAIELSFKYLELVELEDKSEEAAMSAPKSGDTASVAFMLDNEFGLGNFKKAAKPFAEAMGFANIRDIVEGVKDVECFIVTSLRKDKNDSDKKYLQVKEIGIA